MIGHEGGVYRPNFIIPHLKSGRVCAGMSVRHPDLPNKKWQGLRQNHWQGLPRNRWQGLDRNSGRVYVGILRQWIHWTIGRCIVPAIEAHFLMVKQ